ncbi:DUF308 domain-containing protein [Mangrovivirga sp. M17]|uniref:DUF308 domain-containing protein n=1 Tax=Mangrovivirga halotolerans TaxID=2993936 RepID=A0ABT3RQU8_9BACT|nr:DUF308 domain-containing protein [Mangrovivirga halotolerans]MCX2744152.1 DUF308 domain-containing protein [Mangrovivirga halotolerans]
MEKFKKTLQSSVKHWYLHLIIGMALLILGFMIISRPLEAYVTLAIYFSILFLFNGVLEIFYSITNKDTIDSWGWSLVMGILDFIVGLILVSNLAISLTVLAFVVGFGVLFRSLMAISWSLELKKYENSGWGWIMAFAILGLLFSFMLLWNPGIAQMTVVFWTAFAMFSIGIFEITFSFRLKKLKPAKVN